MNDVTNGRTTEDDRRVVVIGSGPAGATAALTLLQNGIPVTLLESGQNLPVGTHVRAMGRTLYRKWPTYAKRDNYVPTDDPTARWHHDLAPGGMSNYWTGAVPRFAPEDFNEGERLHERYRWPITYDELRPFYERAESIVPVSGTAHDALNLPASHVAYECSLASDWQRIAPYAADLGHGLVPTPLSEGTPWLVERHGAPFNSYTNIIQKLQGRPDFQLMLGAHALRLEWRGDKKRVDSIVYFDRATNSEARIPAAAVVVAAGPLASTKLLLDSTSADFPNGLGNTEDLLGRYLHDHSNTWCIVGLEKPLSRLGHTVYFTRAPYEESEPLLAASNTLGNANSFDRILALTPTRTTRFGVVSFGTMVPVESNYALPHETEKDEFGLPKLDLHLHYDDSVKRTIYAGQQRLLEVLDKAGYHGKIETEEFPLVPGNSVHFGGTVRMHASPKYGMLNAWNRMHAVDNVVVADASSFTTGAEKNPTITVMALAVRAAERLAMDLKSQ